MTASERIQRAANAVRDLHERVDDPSFEDVAAAALDGARGESVTLAELDAKMRTAAEHPDDGRPVEGILLEAGKLIRNGMPLADALAQAADPYGFEARPDA